MQALLCFNPASHSLNSRRPTSNSHSGTCTAIANWPPRCWASACGRCRTGSPPYAKRPRPQVQACERQDLARCDLAPGLAMRAATQAAQVDDHCDQQPQKIDSRRRHAAIKFPRVYDRGKRQENETEYRKEQAAVECALQVGREKPH